MRALLAAAALGCLGLASGCLARFGQGPQVPVLSPLPGVTAPRVAYGLGLAAQEVAVELEAGPCGERARQVRAAIALAGDRGYRSGEPQPGTLQPDGQTRFRFVVPLAALSSQPGPPAELHLAFQLHWYDAQGVEVARERYLCRDRRAPHAPLPDDPALWTSIDLADYAVLAADARDRIRIAVPQPFPGKVTVVIDDPAGKRVRNLISGQAVAAGKQVFTWDGTDDAGQLVPPGNYRFRAASHPGIVPEYLFSFYNPGRPPYNDGTPGSAWGADHSDPVAAAFADGRVYLGWPVAEGGHNIVQLTPDGRKTGHANIPPHVGQGTIFLAAGQNCYYALTEGKPWYTDPKQLDKSSWRFTRPLSLMRWDAATGRPLPYDGARGEKVLVENPIELKGEKPNAIRVPRADNLAGAAWHEGKLYVSLAGDGKVLVVAPDKGQTVGELPLPGAGLLASNGAALYALAGGRLWRADLAKGEFAALGELPLSGAPGGFAVSALPEFYVADCGPDQNVQVFAADGKRLRQVGRQGGRPRVGTWDPGGMSRPRGLALDAAGKLWVAENDTWPRRISAWQAAAGSLAMDFFGPCFYGANGGAFDPQDHTRWIGGGCLWQLDFQAKTARPLSVLYRQTKAGQLEPALAGMSFNFVRRDGRSFLVAQHRYSCVYELLPSGEARLWAVLSPTHNFAHSHQWRLPKVCTEIPAYRPALAKFAGNVVGEFQDWIDVNPTDFFYGPGAVVNDLPPFLWVDRNGDGIAQAEEFEVAAAGQRLEFPYWGGANPTLDLKTLASMGDKQPRLLTLACAGFLPSGAPDYRLAEAFAASRPLASGFRDAAAIIQDRAGNFLVNATPMLAFDAAGHELWRFPNRWVSVHGSHDAPLPEPGVTQGVLWFLGTAPLDRQGEVTVMNGNHGRFFVMTTDGLYLDEMFKDCRVTQTIDPYLIGGECFGGTFGRGEDGNYYLQSGGNDYRLFRVHGLDQLVRCEGALTVSPGQMAAAQRDLERRELARARQFRLEVPELPSGQTLDRNPEKWPGPWLAEWGDQRLEQPYAKVKISRSGDTLNLAWRVKDPSPWVNRGNDWKQLFKTGDSVDFQFSTDPAAKPNRGSPVSGDRRLLVAPCDGKPIAVLYRHREAQPAAQPVVFSSPWRAEKVDRVERLDQAQVAVAVEGGWYTVTVRVPLAALGLPAGGAPAALKGDFGVIYGDSAGTVNLLRSYWANQATGLVNDVPGEIMLTPNLWGELNYGGGLRP